MYRAIIQKRKKEEKKKKKKLIIAIIEPVLIIRFNAVYISANH